MEDPVGESSDALAATQLAARKPTPIAFLSPALADQAAAAIRGEVTVIWPYNSVTKILAFLLAEPDARLRRAKGQVRVQLHGSSAQAVAAIGIGAGDTLLLALDGVEWARDESPGRVLGARLDWQLDFGEKLLLQAQLGDTRDAKIIHVDHPAQLADKTTSGIPEVGTIPPRDDPATQASSSASPIAHSPPTPSLVRRAPDLLGGEYNSPAFLKRDRLSYGSIFEGGFDPFEDDGGVRGQGRKRPRFSLDHRPWRYTSRTSNPQPERQADPQPEMPAEEDAMDEGEDQIGQDAQRPSSRATNSHMSDQGCQTMEYEMPPVPHQFSDQSDAVVEPSQKPVPEPLPEPVLEPVPEPVLEPVPEPVLEPVPEPVLEPVPEPTPEPVREPALGPAPEPCPEPAAPGPAPEPDPEPVSDPNDVLDHAIFGVGSQPSIFGVGNQAAFSMFGAAPPVQTNSSIGMADQVRFGFAHTPETNAFAHTPEMSAFDMPMADPLDILPTSDGPAVDLLGAPLASEYPEEYLEMPQQKENVLVDNEETHQSSDEVGVEDEDGVVYDEYGDRIAEDDYDQRAYQIPADDDDGSEQQERAAYGYEEGEAEEYDQEESEEEEYPEDPEASDEDEEQEGISLGPSMRSPEPQAPASTSQVVIDLISDSEGEDDPRPPQHPSRPPAPADSASVAIPKPQIHVDGSKPSKAKGGALEPDVGSSDLGRTNGDLYHEDEESVEDGEDILLPEHAEASLGEDEITDEDEDEDEDNDDDDGDDDDVYNDDEGGDGDSDGNEGSNASTDGEIAIDQHDRIPTDDEPDKTKADPVHTNGFDVSQEMSEKEQNGTEPERQDGGVADDEVKTLSGGTLEGGSVEDLEVTRVGEGGEGTLASGGAMGDSSELRGRGNLPGRGGAVEEDSRDGPDRELDPASASTRPDASAASEIPETPDRQKDKLATPIQVSGSASKSTSDSVTHTSDLELLQPTEEAVLANMAAHERRQPLLTPSQAGTQQVSGPPPLHGSLQGQVEVIEEVTMCEIMEVDVVVETEAVNAQDELAGTGEGEGLQGAEVAGENDKEAGEAKANFDADANVEEMELVEDAEEGAATPLSESMDLDEEPDIVSRADSVSLGEGVAMAEMDSEVVGGESDEMDLAIEKPNVDKPKAEKPKANTAKEGIETRGTRNRAKRESQDELQLSPTPHHHSEIANVPRLGHASGGKPTPAEAIQADQDEYGDQEVGDKADVLSLASPTSRTSAKKTKAKAKKLGSPSPTPRKARRSTRKSDQATMANAAYKPVSDDESDMSADDSILLAQTSRSATAAKQHRAREPEKEVAVLQEPKETRQQKKRQLGEEASPPNVAKREARSSSPDISIALAKQHANASERRKHAAAVAAAAASLPAAAKAARLSASPLAKSHRTPAAIAAPAMPKKAPESANQASSSPIMTRARAGNSSQQSQLFSTQLAPLKDKPKDYSHDDQEDEDDDDDDDDRGDLSIQLAKNSAKAPTAMSAHMSPRITRGNAAALAAATASAATTAQHDAPERQLRSHARSLSASTTSTAPFSQSQHSYPATPTNNMSHSNNNNNNTTTSFGSTNGRDVAHRLKADLAECLPLRDLRHHVNKVVPEVVGVVAHPPTEPSRAKGGPREYVMSFRITDPANGPGGRPPLAEVQLFRPHKDTLPRVAVGDAVLLRGFQVRALAGKGFGLRSSGESAWAVWSGDCGGSGRGSGENGGNGDAGNAGDRAGRGDEDEGGGGEGGEGEKPQMRGPPVEDWAKYASDMAMLRGWYAGMDQAARGKLEKANGKFEEGG